ncbi:MAG: diaminopimelate epimerase [Coriobacteriia bacterium]|nr:diaminopimelate epimerase [Coriobacteriia bacterium]
MELAFVKMHGLGNDFVVMNDLAEELDLAPEAVQWFCDRNFGIGGDGLILVRPATTPEADFYMLYYNADGTTAEMCGNGVRCFAKYVIDHGLLPADRNEVRVETLGGIKPVEVTRAYDGTLYLATVDMGEPILKPADVPTAMRCGNNDDMVIQCALETEMGTFDVTPLSMGNPHCVLWVEDIETAPVHELGPIIENHPMFPQKTNVEFAQLAGENIVRLRVWERGVGETLACGTGACATAVVASVTLRTDREITIELLGGELEIRWAENDHVYMTGPAEEVFAGIVAIDEDDE